MVATSVKVKADEFDVHPLRGPEPAGEFVIDHVGVCEERHFQDVGIEYYRYAPRSA